VFGAFRQDRVLGLELWTRSITPSCPSILS
jgi:hypothetical protein